MKPDRIGCVLPLIMVPAGLGVLAVLLIGWRPVEDPATADPVLATKETRAEHWPAAIASTPEEASPAVDPESMPVSGPPLRAYLAEPLYVACRVYVGAALINPLSRLTRSGG